MFAIGNDELAKKPKIGKVVNCPQCGNLHTVEYVDKLLPDGTWKKSSLLAFVRCADKTYLVGISGKRI